MERDYKVQYTIDQDEGMFVFTLVEGDCAGQQFTVEIKHVGEEGLECSLTLLGENNFDINLVEKYAKAIVTSILTEEIQSTEDVKDD